MGVGNVYSHYDNVVEAFVWRTVRHNLAPLLTAIEQEIDSLDIGA